MRGVGVALDELQDLVDAPRETLAAEYKDWLDLDDNIARANLARHLAALCNFGGGYVVFGFSDDLVPTGRNPFPEASYSRDSISSIVKRYLSPPFQCDVRVVRSAAGQSHVVVVVPPHGAVPVCAKAAGPDADGKPKGIRKGIHYIRKAGPESAPVESPEDWTAIIRRCALHDRQSILAALGAALEGSTPKASLETELERWHDAARPRFELGAQTLDAHSLILGSNEHLSYPIEHPDSEGIPAAELRAAVREMNFEIRDRVNTGWSMFYPFSREPIAPFTNVDPAAGTGEQEFLEANLWEEGGRRNDAELWRISTDGRATLIRPISGDFAMNPLPGWTAGKMFSPHFLLQDLGEFVRHAQAHLERFPGASRVAFRCEFRGLGGRQIGHPGRDWREGRIARSDRRVATGVYTAVGLGRGLISL